MDGFNIIIEKLEAFIKKYYLFKIAKGLLFVLGLYVLVVLFESLVEYFNYMNAVAKTLIFYLSISIFLLLFIYYFILPFLSLFKLRNHLSYSDAAKIISKHFPDIKDRLLNALELYEINQRNHISDDLLIASISQRSNELSPLPFKHAVNFNYVKRNLLFFAGSIVILTFIFAFSPKVLTEGTSRLIDYKGYYERESPFRFNLLNTSLICEKGKNFKVQLKVSGEYIPENTYIKIGDNQFLMEPAKQLGFFEFELRNINNSIGFQFFADNYHSQKFNITVLPAPVLKSFSIDIVPPSYTGVESSKVLNAGDITVPFGTDIRWNFNTLNVNAVDIIYNSDTVRVDSENNLFTNSRRILKTTNYSVLFANENFVTNNDLRYTISVIPDQFPEILLKQVEDSLKVGAYYYMISVKDDYGFNDLKFVAQIVSADSSVKKITKKLSLNKLNKIQDVFYYYNFNDVELVDDNSHIEYYFEVSDNDYISGFKKSRTSAKIFKPLNNEDVRKASEEYESKTDKAIEKSKELTKSIQKEIEDFKRKELRGEVNQWDKQNFLKSIMEKQQNLDELVDNLSENNEKKNSLNNQFYEEQKSIMEKQEQIQKLLDEILDDEMKQLLKEIEELSKNLDEKKFEDVKDRLDLSYKNLDEKLDRSLELLKRYQIEENVMHLSEDLEKLSNKQEQLSEEKQNNKTKEAIQEKQKDLNKQLQDLKEEFKSTQDKNQELKNPYKFEQFDQEFNNIEQKMDELQQNMPNNSKKGNKQQQQQISKEMKDLSEKMQDMFNQMNMQALNMNMQDLRQLIDNLTTFSFNQEDNYEKLNKNFTNSPQFTNIISHQDKIKKDYSLIKDSLSTLSKRIPQMGQMIAKESEALQFDLEKANTEIEERHRRTALTLQRQIINSANTLTLYLDELMQQMENQMQNSGSGKGQPMPQQAMQNLKKQQENLKQELEKLLEQMKQQKPGEKPGGEMNKQIVKSLAEQEIFNKMLDDLQRGKGLNPEGEQKLKEIKKLSEKNIEDLINKNITPELFKRNERIKTRLLEAEKSEREREQEKKRESKEGNKKDIVVPEELKESLKKNNSYKETLQKNNLNMKKYYENLSKEYFRIINE